MPRNLILIGREKAGIESFSPKVAYRYCFLGGPLLHVKDANVMCQYKFAVSYCIFIESTSVPLSGGALITFAEGAAGDRRDQTNGRQHHTLQWLRFFFFFFKCFCGERPTLRRKSLLSWGFQFATVHSWWWVIPGTYFFKTKNEIAF